MDGRTTSSDVQNTYYGLPVIKAPHWRWLIITYFFLGALAGGNYIISTLADLAHGDRAIVRWGRYLSLAALLPSPPLLILDLGRPERFLHMLRIVKLRSAMSLGSWALVGLSIFAGLLGFLQALDDFVGVTIPAGARRALGIAGLPFAAFVSGYTGVLLGATNVPLWARNYLMLGPTFVCSAFSTSFASLSLLLGITGEREETAARLQQAEAIALGAELGLLTAGIVRLGRLGRPLTAGRWGRLFWPGTYLGGTALPLALQLSGIARGRPLSPGLRRLSAVLVLGGGFLLRTVMIFAGRESASRPEDYFEYTRTRFD